MTHRTDLAHRDEALQQVTLVDLVTTVTCPTCHAPAGSRCVTRTGKPAADSHNGRYDAVEQAAGITQSRADLRRSAGGFSYGIDRQAEAALLAAYAVRIRPCAEQNDEPVPPAAPTQQDEHLRRARQDLSVAAQLLHAVADLIGGHKPEERLTTTALGLAFATAGANVLAQYPGAVRDAALLRALAALVALNDDSIAQGITGGEYALRLRLAAKAA
ncbi:hypothetical protein ACFXPI_11060 [Streptomyces sp. NPDC059104]|uniref:zinc finger domain-containing protein n=1 Tax=Streptomyces sp. NPDC059104 TaxID=3346729 RepID=UPI0036A2F845